MMSSETYITRVLSAAIALSTTIFRGGLTLTHALATLLRLRRRSWRAYFRISLARLDAVDIF